MNTKMADRIEYQKKLKELQKYVPFLENTINKLTREPGKPRQQQISKLQSLLEILTDTSRKLKLDALGRCEEVILKLQAQVEKKASSQNMHKFMCRTPPEPDRFDRSENNRLADARNRLKQIELVTPASPSPPLDAPRAAPKPVVIPTEKVIPVVESRRPEKSPNKFRSINQPYPVDSWDQSLADQIMPLINIQPILHPARSHVVDVPKWQRHMQWDDEPRTEFGAPLYQRRSDLRLPHTAPNRPTSWSLRGSIADMPHVVTHDDFSRAPSPLASIYEPKPRIVTPLAEPNRLDLSKVLRTDTPKSPEPVKSATLSNPPLSESDLLALLSPVDTSSSNSPKVDEDMDIDRLEQLRESLRKEIGDLKPDKDKEPKPIKILHKTTTPIPSSAYAAKPKTPKVVERVVKESTNIFGSLLCSIDEKIMVKQKKDVKRETIKTEGTKKELIKISFKNKPKEVETSKVTDSKTKSKEDSNKSSVKHKEEKQREHDRSKEHPKKDKHKGKERHTSESSDAGKKDEKIKHKVDSKPKEKLDESKSKGKTDESKSKVVDESKLKTIEPKSKVGVESKAKTSEPKFKVTDEMKVKTSDSKSKVTGDSKVKTSESKSKVTGDLKAKSSESKSKVTDVPKVTTNESKSKVTDDSKEKTSESKVTDESKAKASEPKSKVKSSESKSSVKTDESKSKAKNELRMTKSDRKSIDDSNKICDIKKKLEKDIQLADKSDQNVKNVESKSKEPFPYLYKHYNKTKDNVEVSTEVKPKGPPLYHDIVISKDVSQIVKDLLRKQNRSDNKYESKIKVKKLEREKLAETLSKNKDSAKLRIDNEDSCSTYSTKSDSSIEENHKPKPNSEIKYANTGRLSDKYPHKRKTSTDSAKSSDSLTHTNIPLLGSSNQVLKISDPRLRTQHIPFQKQGPHLDSPNKDQFRPVQNESHFQKQAQFADYPVDQFRAFQHDPRTPGDPFLNSPPNEHNCRLGEFQNRPDPNQQNFQNRNFPMRSEDSSFANFQNNQFRPPSQHNADPRMVAKTEVDKSIWVRGYEQYPHGRGYEDPSIQNRGMDNHRAYDNPQNHNRGFETHNRGFENQSNQNWGFENNNRGLEIQQKQNVQQYDLTKIGPIDYFETYRPSSDPSKKLPLLETPILGQKTIPSLLDKNVAPSNFAKRGSQGGRWNKGIFRGRGQPRGGFDRRGAEHYPRGSEHREGFENHPRGSDFHSRGKDPRAREYHSRGSLEHNRGSMSRGGFHNPRRNSYEKSDLNEDVEKVERNVRSSVDENNDKSEQNKLSEITQVESDSDKVKVADESTNIETESNANSEQKTVKKFSIHNFKIPKIKRPTIEEKVEPEKIEEPVKTEPPEEKEQPENISEEIITNDIVKVEAISDAKSSTSQDSEVLKSEENKPEQKPEDKTDIVNEFIQKLLQQGDTSAFINVLEKLGESIPKLKYKRVRRIIDSDSEDENSSVTEAQEQNSPQPQEPAKEDKPVEEPQNKEEIQIEEPEKVVESVGERIKNRRRVPQTKSDETEPKKPMKIRKKRSSLEMLQDDIREMFICEGVLTASERQRMCRIIREQEEALQKFHETPKKSEEDTTPTKKGKAKPRKKAGIPTNTEQSRTIRSSPRVVLEKTDMSKYHLKHYEGAEESSEDEDIPQKPKRSVRKTEPANLSELELDSDKTSETSSPQEKSIRPLTRRTRSSMKVEKEIDLDSDFDTASIASTSVSEKNDSPPKTKPKTGKKKGQKVEEATQNDSDNESLASLAISEKNEATTKNSKAKTGKKKAAKVEEKLENDSDNDNVSIASSSISEKFDTPSKIAKGKMVKKKKRSNWAMGVIKNMPKKRATRQKMESQNEETEQSVEQDMITINPPETKQQEIQIDLKPDINYYLDNKKNEKQCKLCSFKGRFIVHHYRNQHPDSENMISRLSPKMAQLAIEESRKLNFDTVKAVDEDYKLKKDRVSFSCRFCTITLKHERACSFYDHVAIHTGEYRYACEHCSIKTCQRKILNTHYSTLHHNVKRNTAAKPLWPNPPDFRIVFGYICDLCNFTQLEKSNVEKHLKEAHAGEKGTILKISMSSKAVPLPGQEMKPITNEMSVEQVEIKEKDTPKMPDLKVFMTSESIDNEDKRIEEERLKKMQEVCDKLKNAKRSGLLFINKLHDKLNTARDNEINDQHLTDDSENSNKSIEIVNEPKIADKIDYAHKETNILATCLLKNETDPVESTPNVQPDIESVNTTNETFVKLSNMFTTNKKHKPVTGTILRLTAKLQNPIDLPKIPEILSASSKSDEYVPLIINIGVMKATIYNKNYKKYNCLVETCPYKTAWTSESDFKNHCINAHPTSYNICSICGGLPLDIIGNYYHLKEIHCPDYIIEQFEQARKQILHMNEPTESNTVSKETAANITAEDVTKPLLKIRKLPGDILSANKPPEKIVTPDITSAENNDTNDFGFTLQISDVKTLTLEEEQKLYTAEEVAPTVTAEKAKPCTAVSQESEKTIKEISPYTLKALYKCPDNCDFATNIKNNFIMHFTTAHSKSKFSCVMCTYCEDILIGKDYANHVELRHGHCSYLCVYCNYRACMKTYVEVHEQKLHFKKEIIILHVESIQGANKLDDSLDLEKAILPYTCRQGTCVGDFLLAEDFKSHATKMKHRFIICHLCKPSQKFLNFGALINHYLSHGIGSYQCKYCVYACKYPEEMFLHYTKMHPTQHPIAMLRSHTKLLQKPEQITHTDMEIFDLNSLYADSIHKAVPFSVYVKEKGLENASEVESDDDIDIEDTADEPPTPKEIETIDLVEDEVIESEKQLESLNEPMITVIHRNAELESAIVNAVDPLSMELDPLETTEPTADQIQVEKAKDAISTNTPFELYRCGTKDCNFTADTATKFKEHLFSCDVLKEGGYYNCVHCTKKFKYIWALTEHIQVHGTLRYVCSICDHRAPLEHIITKHMKIKHKIHTCKVVPNDDLFIAVPNYKSVLKNQAKANLESNEEKISFEPEEFEKLPRMAIYSQERKCVKCGYSTKVRTNLYRHLQAHLQDAPVPETAPVNPVPCLEKNEKMFDKMLNLANSSFSGGRMGGKTEKPNPIESDLPAFVPVSKRFVCGAEGCNYLTHDDSMLKYHFNALHSDENIYKCPHCKIELSNDFGEINIDQIVFHLRMHDLHLYKCSLCDYIHYQRHKVDRHLLDKHPNKVPYIHVIRELDNSANLEGDERSSNTEVPSEIVKEPKEDKLWKCGFCRQRSQTENDIKTHIAEAHGVESRYKCSLCSFTCDTPTNFTSHAKTHPNSEVMLLSIYFQCDNASEKSTVTHNDTESFDTTPIWRRDTARVKNIRGILIEEGRSSKKTPKSQEKIARVDLKCYENLSKNLFMESEEIDSKEAIADMIKSFGDFGSPVENKFACPFCKEHQTLFKRKFVSHLYQELNYNRYKCASCTFKAPDYNTASDHFTETHSKDLKPNIKPLTPDHAIERWVDKVLQFQTKEIQKYKAGMAEADETQSELNATDPLKTEPNTNSNEGTSEMKEEVIPHEDLLVASSSTSVKILSPTKMHKCDECNFEAKTLKMFTKHKQMHKKPIHCKLCPYTGYLLKSLKLHFTIKHPNEKLAYTKETLKRKRNSTDSEESSSPNKKIIIDFDQSEMNAESTISKDNIRYSCLHCSIIYTDLDILKLHFIHEHWTQKIKSFCKYKIIDVTMPMQTSNYVYKCKYCEFVATSVIIVDHHQEKHQNMKFSTESICEYICRFCGFTNKNLSYFRKHLRSHNQGQIAYDVVHEVSEGPPTKENVHVISDENIISQSIPTFYKCKFCNENLFESEEILRKHHHTFHSHLELNLKVSTLYKYKCPNQFCEFSTNVLNDMKEHVRVHTKTFKCVYCTAEFTYQTLLQDHHTKTHSAQPFNFTIEENPLKLNKELKDSLQVLGHDGTYTTIKERVSGVKRPASEELEHPDKKIQAIASSETVPRPKPVRKFANVAKKSTATPPKRAAVAKKSTTPVKPRKYEGFSFYGAKPTDFNEYRNLTTEANIQGNMVRVSVIGLQYILKLFPKVLVEDIYKNP